MAGTLEVTDELCWMPAGWVFDAVLEHIAAELHTQDPELAAQLLDARTAANGGYLDLRNTVVYLGAADIFSRPPPFRLGAPISRGLALQIGFQPLVHLC